MKTIALVTQALTVSSVVQGFAQDVTDFLDIQTPHSITKTLENINPLGTLPGTVIAATSKVSPPYYFHWTRDGSLTFDAIVSEWKKAPENSELKLKYEKLILDFTKLSRKHQHARACDPNVCHAMGGPGEPKYNVDGNVYTGQWGRYQNDGPALRASTLIRFAIAYIENGASLETINQHFYNPDISSRSVIKVDLEYVAHNWRQKNFDLWEEVHAHHFYTRMAQRRALYEGAEFANLMGDIEASRFYYQQAEEISKVIENEHWDHHQNYIREQVDCTSGSGHDRDQRNVATILAVLHSKNNLDGFFGPTDDRILSTVFKLQLDFEGLYNINKLNEFNGKPVGLAIGRYKEDVYDGSQGINHHTLGNPWFLSTLAVSELYYQIVVEYKKAGVVKVTDLSLPFFEYIGVQGLQAGQEYMQDSSEFAEILKRLVNEADKIVRRVQLHAGDCSTGCKLDEQYSRDDGFQVSAENLTWSYVSVMTTQEMREEALKKAGCVIDSTLVCY